MAPLPLGGGKSLPCGERVDLLFTLIGAFSSTTSKLSRFPMRMYLGGPCHSLERVEVETLNLVFAGVCG